MIDRDVFTGKLNINKKEKLTFGKYNGVFINNVMITDPWYMVWVIDYLKREHRYNPISDTWVEYIKEYAEKNKEPNYAGDYKKKIYKTA